MIEYLLANNFEYKKHIYSRGLTELSDVDECIDRVRKALASNNWTFSHNPETDQLIEYLLANDFEYKQHVYLGGLIELPDVAERLNRARKALEITTNNQEAVTTASNNSTSLSMPQGRSPIDVNSPKSRSTEIILTRSIPARRIQSATVVASKTTPN